MTWEQAVVGVVFFVMFCAQLLSAFVMVAEKRARGLDGWTPGAYTMLLLASCWLLLAGVLHLGGFW